MATRTAQETAILTPAQALAFVERHGIVCESARRGEVPSLADTIAGETICGNWWSHRDGKRIFALTRAVRASPHVLVCRIVEGKITFVHERLWPALVRLANEFPHDRLARLHEVHSATGSHVVEGTPFPDWVPKEIAKQADALDLSAAQHALQSASVGWAGRSDAQRR